MERKLITDEYISPPEIGRIMDDIDKYSESGELKTNASIREDIAKRVILTEKERIRLDIIFVYGLDYEDIPILELVDRDMLIDAYIADGKHEDIDTVEGICQCLIDEPYRVCRWIETVGVDIFDDFRRIKNTDD